MSELRHLRTSIEVRRPIQDTCNAQVQAKLPSTAYNAGGCRSYYIDANGRNSFSWPWSTNHMVELLSRFDPADYRVGEHASRSGHAAPG